MIFFLTPLILLNNVVRYLGSLSLPQPGIEVLNTPLATTATASGGASKSFKFKIAYGVIAWAVAFILIMSAFPNTVDKYYPV